MTEPIEEKRLKGKLAAARAKTTLKKGDRLRATRCPGNKRWVTFDHWDGQWIVTKSGICDIHPLNVDMINDRPIDFTIEIQQ